MPYNVAKDIYFNSLHPVAAWRHYFHLDQSELAKFLECSVQEIRELETSNKHLIGNWLTKLCKLFSITEDALNFRFNHYQQ
jgi:predicted transcriptional regulator